MTNDTCEVERVFEGIAYTPLRGADAVAPVRALEFSSRDVHPGALFFCVKGTSVDGHVFAQDACERGAAALVVERELPLDIPQFLVEDSREALALCSANFYGKPSQDVKVVGITGTNGKTTTAFLVEHLIKYAGRKAGLIGTVECHIADRVIPSEHTTPESRDFQKLLSEMRDAGVDACACEVSSHALDLGRVRGTHFAVAAFSNLSQDHLDYHNTMEEYFEAKARLFTDYAPGTSVICIDSEAGKTLAKRVRAHGGNLLQVGAGPECDIRVMDAQYHSDHTVVELGFLGDSISINLPLVGKFNVENILLALGIGHALGIPQEQLVEALENAPQVPGRLERVMGATEAAMPFTVLVDYAHTPDSLEKAIGAVRAVTKGRVICVFGCGGDRDKGKRPKMGAASLAADLAIVTSDNPRTEDPDDIIKHILAGMSADEGTYYVVPDRAEAIHRAIAEAQPQDTVLIAGKGHEDYQIIGTTKHHFDDREVAAKALQEMGL